MIKVMTDLVCKEIRNAASRDGVLRVGTAAMNGMLSGGGLAKRASSAGWTPNEKSTQKQKSRMAGSTNPWSWSGRTQKAFRQVLQPQTGRQGDILVQLSQSKLTIIPWSLGGPKGTKDISSKGKLLRALGSLEFGYGKMAAAWGSSKKKGYVSHSRFEDVHTRKVVKTGIFGFGAKKTVHVHSKATPKVKTLKSGKQKVTGVRSAKGAWKNTEKGRAGRPWFSLPLSASELEMMSKLAMQEMAKIMNKG